MRKNARFLIFIFIFLSFCGCLRRPESFDPKEDDLLTPGEKKELLDSVRVCIAENKTLAVNSYERRRIMKVDPVSYKIHYLGRKYGRVSILWAFPAERQILASYQGPLLLKKQYHPYWKVRVITGKTRGSKDPALYGL